MLARRLRPSVKSTLGERILLAGNASFELSRLCAGKGPAQTNTAVQRQTAVTAYFTSKQLLPFVFARYTEKKCNVIEHSSMSQDMTAPAC